MLPTVIMLVIMFSVGSVLGFLGYRYTNEPVDPTTQAALFFLFFSGIIGFAVCFIWFIRLLVT